MSSDPHQLQRFLDAQAPVYTQALSELQAGEKQSHWMWFIFPQVAGLGSSSMAQRYAIASLDEARAYLAHPVLSERLRACCQAMLQHPEKSATAILGVPDDSKLRSSMSLFTLAAPEEPLFQQVLATFYGGQDDGKTRALLGL